MIEVLAPIFLAILAAVSGAMVTAGSIKEERKKAGNKYEGTEKLNSLLRPAAGAYSFLRTTAAVLQREPMSDKEFEELYKGITGDGEMAANPAGYLAGKMKDYAIENTIGYNTAAKTVATYNLIMDVLKGNKPASYSAYLRKGGMKEAEIPFEYLSKDEKLKRTLLKYLPQNDSHFEDVTLSLTSDLSNDTSRGMYELLGRKLNIGLAESLRPEQKAETLQHEYLEATLDSMGVLEGLTVPEREAIVNAYLMKQRMANPTKNIGVLLPQWEYLYGLAENPDTGKNSIVEKLMDISPEAKNTMNDPLIRSMVEKYRSYHAKKPFAG